MKVHTIHEAKTNLSKLIQKACAGEEVIIAKGKTPVARIVPIAAAQKKRVLGGFEGRVWASEDAFAPLTEEELRNWGLE
jgi:prevent-host-death family protein